MVGILINGIKYMSLMNDNEFKKKSLYDNVYFTLRDIFANADFHTCMEANIFNSRLTNNIRFEDRTEIFQYTNALDEKDFLNSLEKWLKPINIYWFDFYELEKDEEIDMKEYIKLDDWMVQLEELKYLIKEQYKKKIDL
jgi:hypothetical protein